MQTLKFANALLQTLYIGVVLVIFASGEAQVFDPVVGSLPIQVMNEFVTRQFTTKARSHDVSMFENVFPCDINEHVAARHRTPAAPLRIVRSISAHDGTAINGDAGLYEPLFYGASTESEMSRDLADVQAGRVCLHHCRQRDSARSSAFAPTNAVAIQSSQYKFLRRVESVGDGRGRLAVLIETNDFVRRDTRVKWSASQYTSWSLYQEERSKGL